MIARTMGIGALVALLSAPGMSHAQGGAPDPFADYAREVSPPPATSPRPASAPTATSAARLATEAGGWSTGGRVMLSYSSRKNEVADGQEESNSNLFIRFAPALNYFLVDEFQLGVAFGPMVTSLARPGTDDARELDWLVELTANYFLRSGERFAFAPGIGVGVFFGSSDRKLILESGDEVSEATSTLGVAVSGYLSAVYQLSKTVQIRSGLAFTGLIGRESIDSESSNFSTRSMHLGFPVELFYTF